MAFIKLNFVPGINQNKTNYSGSGGWWDCDKIRFNQGFPQKLGGWVKYSPNEAIGTCRQMHNWVNTYSDNFMAVGTNEKVYIESGGNFFNITPMRLTLSAPNTVNCVNTLDNSNYVTINLGTAHGAQTGEIVYITGVVGDVGGIPNAQINAEYRVVVIDADSFYIITPSFATSTVAGGGGSVIDVSFELPVGNASDIYGAGWGAGGWGREAWGLGSSVPVVVRQRDWWFDNFDNDLVGNIRNGGAYWWERGNAVDPFPALDTRMISLSDYAVDQGFSANAVPSKIMQLMVSQTNRHLIAFGAVPFGFTAESDFDPLLIRWADQDTPADWTPTELNTAGDLRVSRGSRIVRALSSRQEILVWTDASLYSLQFLGSTDVFGLQEYADNISIASPRAVSTASNVVYWMGQDKFYVYTGRVGTLPCTVHDAIFNNINYAQSDQIISGTNEQWSEIWWFYPSADSDWNNRYVVFNYEDNIWFYGAMSRTAWLDTPLRQYPQAVLSPNDSGVSYIMNHEIGCDDDTAPMDSFIVSNDIELNLEGDPAGGRFLLCSRLVPDIKFTGSSAPLPNATFQILQRNYPGSALSSDPADSKVVSETSVGVFTDQVFIRARARQMAFKIQSSGQGVFWQLGSPRLDVRPDGRR